MKAKAAALKTPCFDSATRGGHNKKLGTAEAQVLRGFCSCDNLGLLASIDSAIAAANSLRAERKDQDISRR